MILRLSVSMILVGLIGCAPLRKDGGDADAIQAAQPADEDAEPRLKVAYSNDDITEVAIIPSKLLVEPWQPVQLFLAGTLPDKTKGRIPSEVTWEVDDTDVAVIGKTGGQLIATKVGDLKITAKFRKFTDERTIRIRWITPLHQELKEPKNLASEAVDDSIARVTWDFGDGPITGHQLAYQEGEAPGTCEEVDDTGKVVEAGEIGDLTEVAIFGLKPDTAYGVRVCSVQELSTEDQMVKRLSPGEITSVTTKAN